MAAVGAWVVSFPVNLPILAWGATVLVMMVVVAAISLRIVRRPLGVERSIDPVHVEAGEGFTVTLELSQSTQWREELSPTITADAHGHGRGAAYRAVAQRRGVHAVGPVAITRRDPWGLIEVERHVGHFTSVTVLPRLVPVDDEPVDVGAAAESNRRIGSGQADLIARPYVPGDEVKRLHWKATARRGELMVRQEEDRAHPHLVVVLDHEVGVHGVDLEAAAPATSPSLEWAISMAASLVHHHAAAGEDTRLVGPDHLDLAHDIEARIALAELEPVRDPDRLTLDDVTAQRVIVVTGRLDPRSAEALVASVTGHEVRVIATHVSPGAQEIVNRAGWSTEVRAP